MSKRFIYCFLFYVICRIMHEFKFIFLQKKTLGIFFADLLIGFYYQLFTQFGTRGHIIISNFPPFSKMKSMPLAFSNTQIYARKNLRMHLKKIRQREYSKLRAMVPSVAENNKVSKVRCYIYIFLLSPPHYVVFILFKA